MSDTFSIIPSVVETIRNALHTGDTRFERETNTISSLGLRNAEKLLVTCNGDGTMSVRCLVDPLKRIEELDKFRKEGIITSEEFEIAKKKLLDQI